NIYSNFLFIGTSGLTILKKADFIIAFNQDNNNDVRRVYENFRYNNNGAILSLITDVYTSRVALIYTIELKEARGKAIEAEI
ncbi:hypothetical protein V2W45_1226321, partial [Cenococcum geophilum]